MIEESEEGTIDDADPPANGALDVKKESESKDEVIIMVIMHVLFLSHIPMSRPRHYNKEC
jgi:hypothetical protein